MPFIFVFSFLLFLSGSYASGTSPCPPQLLNWGQRLIVHLVSSSAKGVIDLGPRAYLHLPALLIIATMSFVHIWLNGIQCGFPSVNCTHQGQG